MYETKRYDGNGNLIEVISADQCLKKFWDNFGMGAEITEEQIGKNDQAHGMFHLITTVQRSHVSIAARSFIHHGTRKRPSIALSLAFWKANNVGDWHTARKSLSRNERLCVRIVTRAL